MRALEAELNRCRFAELDVIQVDGVLETIVAVAREQQLWPHVLPLVSCLPEPAMIRLGSIVSGLELTDEEVGRLVSAAADETLREPVLQLAAAAGLTERLGTLAPTPLGGGLSLRAATPARPTG